MLGFLPNLKYFDYKLFAIEYIVPTDGGLI